MCIVIFVIFVKQFYGSRKIDDPGGNWLWHGMRLKALFIDVLPSFTNFLPEFFHRLLFGHALLLHEALHHRSHVPSLLLKLLERAMELLQLGKVFSFIYVGLIQIHNFKNIIHLVSDNAVGEPTDDC